ncbi:MAG: 50S ribosomal protein L6 [candidate division Zixibacteria bacterium]|nr:50S ribosomal protein L6 [candidate division Zixibacteria bacterium]
MSRIGKKPIPIPAGVQVTVDGDIVRVKGPKGELHQSFLPGISVSITDGIITVERSNDHRSMRALHGLTRALIANMITGVSHGFRRVLEIVGVGYKAELNGKRLNLVVGYSHPILITPPDGVNFVVENPTRFAVEGISKQLVGEVAARVRRYRPPEPYKGKGIRYEGEHVRRKAGKTAA